METKINKALPNLKSINSNATRHFHKEGEIGAELEYFLTDSKTGLAIPKTFVRRKSESFTAQLTNILLCQMKQLNYRANTASSIIDGYTPFPASDPGTFLGCTTTTWYAAIFTATSTYDLAYMMIQGGHTSNGRTTTVSIRATSANLPTGSDLDSGPLTGHDWFTVGGVYVPMGGYQIQSGTTYAVVIRSTNGQFNWNYKNGSSSLSASSTDSGSSWTSGTTQFYFQTFSLSGGGDFMAKDTGGTYRPLVYAGDDYATSVALDVLATSGVVTFGTRVGTGNTAVTITDYALQTPVAEGTGSGQMAHGAVTFGSPAADSTTSQFTITRNFTNSSGGSMTINEIGLYCRNFYSIEASLTVGYFMIIRDVIGGGIAVPNGQTLTVNYRPQAVV